MAAKNLQPSPHCNISTSATVHQLQSLILAILSFLFWNALRYLNFFNFSPIVFFDTCNIFNMFETIEILDAEFILQTITCNICNSFYLILFYIHSCQSAIHFDLHSNVLINALERCIWNGNIWLKGFPQTVLQLHNLWKGECKCNKDPERVQNI